MVADIIDPRFRHLVIGLLAASARKEFLDNPHCIFLPFPVETCGRPYFLNCLLSCFRANAVGKNSRHILSAFQIAGIFQSRDCRGYPGFDFRNAVIPARFASNLQCRIRYRGTESGKLLDRLPNLLNLFEGEFGLIEKNKVFIQIVFVEQDITLRLDAFVTSGPACFLNVIFQRVGYVVMNDHTNILFIDAHSESRCRDHNLKFTGYKGILIRRFLPGVHPAMIGPGRESVPGQTSRQLCRPMRTRSIDDRRTTLGFEQAPQSLIFLHRIRLGQHLEVQIRPGGFRSEHLEFERKFFPKITSDVLDDLLFRRSCKTGNRNWLGHILLFLNRSDKIADI